MRFFPGDRLRKAALCRLPVPARSGARLGALLAVLTACTTTVPPPKPPVEPPPMAVEALPGFAADPLDDLQQALDQQCAMAKPPGDWPALCASLRQVPATTRALLRNWLNEHFVARELIPLIQVQGTSVEESAI